jgi:anti-sigma B factor antagonist
LSRALEIPAAGRRRTCEADVTDSSVTPVLTFSLAVRHDVVVVRLSGELDVAESEGVSGILTSAMMLAEHALVVDVSGLTFIDCTGTGALIRASVEAHRGGVAFVLAAPSASLTRLLDHTGAFRRLTVYGSVRQAVNRYGYAVRAQVEVPPAGRSPRGRPAYRRVI